MAFNLPPPPVGNDPGSPAFRDWYYRLVQFLKQPLDLSQASGVLPIVNGGTGLSTVGTAGQVLTVNAGATALEYTNVSGGSAYNIDGGVAASIYNPPGNIDGGNA